ncbi:putative amidohydrolase YtcJ [Catenuloplanes nepalensis]|uniref:Amidohydrolase YtcJ n=1 Tax=Catenuloplanes nepalensis TaxID=587533 RepID=A0ABT9MLA7_9ACTN|nr:amidohydrolase family protein [Catenuloplanes nepalensis]MDP9792207.1 putative amidohydrolase YtcJ [Catenuloplanes nepalensis]
MSGGGMVIVGEVITMDPARPRVRAVAIVDGVVVVTGTVAEARRAVPAGSPEVSVAGTVIPGFVDSHVHLLWAGRRAARVSLTGAVSIAEVQRRLRAHADAHPGAGWIEADDDLDPWDLAESRLPTAAELEDAVPGRGVLLDRRGHDALVSTTALRHAGITATTPDPVGGRIARDAHGDATGLLVEHPAVALVRAVVPPPSDADRRAWIEAGQRALLAHGISTAMDPAVAVPELAAYADAARAGALRLRVVAMPLGSESIDFAGLDRAAADCGLETADPRMLRRGPTKLFLDGGGSLGTALLSTPWPGSDGYHGNQTLSRDVLLAHCRDAARAGRGAGVHAVGDAAIDLVLDVLAEVDAETPIAALGFHLIHAYLGPGAAAMRRAGHLGVRVSAHPALQWDFGAGLIDRLGEERAAAANPLRSWLDAGVEVGGGSDGPGPPMAPLHGMWQARTRRIRGRDTPLGPDQAISAMEALALFTTGAARITSGPDTGVHGSDRQGSDRQGNGVHRSGRQSSGRQSSGRLRPGDVADLALLDGDPLAAEPDALRNIRVTATIVGGTVAFGDLGGAAAPPAMTRDFGREAPGLQ